MAIDSTPGSPTANSYLTVNEADAYLTSSRLYSSFWTAASSPDKERSLIWATVLLDQCMDWLGAIRTIEQALRWPRSGVVDLDGRNIDYDTHPVAVQHATAELALSLLTRDRSAEPQIFGQGISRVKVGPIEVNVDDFQRMVDLIPANVLTMLAPYGQLLDSASSGDGTVRLVRT